MTLDEITTELEQIWLKRVAIEKRLGAQTQGLSDKDPGDVKLMEAILIEYDREVGPLIARAGELIALRKARRI